MAEFFGVEFCSRLNFPHRDIGRWKGKIHGHGFPRQRIYENHFISLVYIRNIMPFIDSMPGLLEKNLASIEPYQLRISTRHTQLQQSTSCLCHSGFLSSCKSQQCITGRRFVSPNNVPPRLLIHTAQSWPIE